MSSTRPKEGKLDLARQDDTDLRWSRVGFCEQGWPVETLVLRFIEEWPQAEIMPPRWSASNAEEFVRKYGPGVKRCDTASYQMLIIDGVPVLRLWHNAKHKMLIEVNNQLAEMMRTMSLFQFERIPEGSKQARREFELRTTITIAEEVTFISTLTRIAYGIHDSRL